MPRIINFITTVFFVGIVLVWAALLNFWFFIFFLFGSLFVVSRYAREMGKLKREKISLAHLLGKNEKKFSNSEIEKNRISEIFINFNEGILVIDENEKVSMINPKAKKILGIKERAVKGLPVIDLARLSDIRPIVPYFLSLNGILSEKINLKKIVVELSVIPLIFEEKNMGRLIILRDITRETVSEKMKTNFILSVAHQLKTSAASVKWSTKMFLSGDFGKINKEQKDVIGRLYKRNDALIFLIDNLLDAEKIEDRAYSYKKTLIDVQDLVQSAIIYFQDKIRSKKIKVKFEKPQQRLPKIMIDKEKIGSVIQSLFDNALKYTGIGGSMYVFLEGDEKNIKFQIKDSGIGIPKEQQSEIFNKFFRAANANKIETNGSGLGLFIAKKIVEDHNGSIWFESEENKGSIFSFTLPIEMVE